MSVPHVGMGCGGGVCVGRCAVAKRCGSALHIQGVVPRESRCRPAGAQKLSAPATSQASRPGLIRCRASGPLLTRLKFWIGLVGPRDLRAPEGRHRISHGRKAVDRTLSAHSRAPEGRHRDFFSTTHRADYRHLRPQIRLIEIDFVSFQKIPILLLKRSHSMMFLLVRDVSNDFRNGRTTHTERAETLLPRELRMLTPTLMNESRGVCLQLPNQFRDRDVRRHANQQMNVIGDGVDREYVAVEITRDATEIFFDLGADLSDQHWSPVLGAEHDVNQQRCVCMSHMKSVPRGVWQCRDFGENQIPCGTRESRCRPAGAQRIAAPPMPQASRPGLMRCRASGPQRRAAAAESTTFIVADGPMAVNRTQYARSRAPEGRHRSSHARKAMDPTHHAHFKAPEGRHRFSHGREAVDHAHRAHSRAPEGRHRDFCDPTSRLRLTRVHHGEAA